MTPDQYDRLIDRMELGGEDRAAADRLAQEKVGPIAQALGLPMPEITEHEVHALLS